MIQVASLKVALLQMASCGPDQAANLEKGERFCREARAMGADIALFPEMWSNGYTLPETDSPAERAAWAAQAIGPDDRFVTHFRALARELDLAIAVTYLERWEPAPRNSVSIIDRHGDIRLTYAKVHTCRWSRERALTPGDAFPVCTLDTRAGDVKLGAMVCFDREHPESARVLMLNGAELVLVPNACSIDGHRLAQLQTRAFENMIGIALANYAAPQENGHSVAFDGMAYTEADVGDGAARDMKLIEAGEAEGIYLATFDLDRMRRYRANEVWGDAFRRPDVYGPLVATEVRPPFVRNGG